MVKAKSNKPKKQRNTQHTQKSWKQNQGKQKPRYQQDKLMNLKTKSNN